MMRAVMSPSWNAAKEAIPVGERVDPDAGRSRSDRPDLGQCGFPLGLVTLGTSRAEESDYGTARA